MKKSVRQLIGILLSVALYLMTVSTGHCDKLSALIGPYVTFGIPMSIFILCDLMKTVPKRLRRRP